MPLLFCSIQFKRSCNWGYVFGAGVIIGWPGIQFAGVEPLAQSAICKALIILKISGINLPIFKGYTRITLTIPLSSIINTFLTVSVELTSLDIIPYFLDIKAFLSATIGKGKTIPVMQ